MQLSVAASEPMASGGDASCRVPSGPLQLGSDWPGYFMRGDEALATASAMRLIADAVERGDELVIKAIPRYLRGLASNLETVRK